MVEVMGIMLALSVGLVFGFVLGRINGPDDFQTI